MSDTEKLLPPTKHVEKPPEDPRKGLPTSVVVEEATTPMELDRTKRIDANGQYIEYIGVGLVRQLTPADWAAAFVDDFSEFCEWNIYNKKRLPRSLFTDKALQYLLRVDGRFRLITVPVE